MLFWVDWRRKGRQEEEEGQGEKEQIQGFCHVGGEGCRKLGGREGEQVVRLCMCVAPRLGRVGRS